MFDQIVELEWGLAIGIGRTEGESGHRAAIGSKIVLESGLDST